jgi:hypothetical protein
MKRREFITALTGLAALPLVARAQQTKTAKLGFVSWQSPAGESQVEYLRKYRA